jgi:hypothetical protein
MQHASKAEYKHRLNSPVMEEGAQPAGAKIRWLVSHMPCAAASHRHTECTCCSASSVDLSHEAAAVWDLDDYTVNTIIQAVRPLGLKVWLAVA